MNLISYGCSFVFGSDLHDASMVPGAPGTPSLHSWPALLARHQGRRYGCRAYPGCGNLLIAERIFLDIPKLLAADNMFVVVSWTWLDRFDYNDPGTPDSWNTLRPTDSSPVSQTYYQHLHSEYRDKLTSLITVKSVIDTLNHHGIPFMMTYMDDLLLDQTWHTSQSIDYLQQSIRPYMTLFEGQTFLNWSRKNGYAESATWHPLEQAHRAAADYMIRLFDTQNTSGPVLQVLS